MGLFDKIFKSDQDLAKKEIVEIPWHPLTELKQLDHIKDESHKQAVAIFKHSTRCGISRMALSKFEKDYSRENEGNVKLYYLDLISNRDISNEVANRFEVQHESPQLIILKDGKVIHHASHHSIEAKSLNEFV